MNLLKQLQETKTQPPSIENLQKQIKTKLDTLQKLQIQTTAFSDTHVNMQNELTYFQQSQQIQTELPQLKLLSFDEFVINFQNKIYNQIKLIDFRLFLNKNVEKLSCISDIYLNQTNIREQLIQQKQFFQNIDYRSSETQFIMILNDSIQQFSYYQQIKLISNYIFYQRMNEVVNRTILFTVEKRNTDYINAHLPSVSGKLSVDLGITAEESIQPEFQKIISKAKYLIEKVKENQIAEYNSQDENIDQVLDKQLNDAQSYQSAFEVLQQTKQAKQDAICQDLYYPNCQIQQNSIYQQYYWNIMNIQDEQQFDVIYDNTLLNNYKYVIKQYNSSASAVIQQPAQIFEDISQKLIQQYLQLSYKNNMQNFINKVVVNQPLNLLYEPAENINYFNENLENDLSTTLQQDNIHDKIVRGPSVIQENTLQINKFTDLKPQFHYCVNFALFSQKNVEFLEQQTQQQTKNIQEQSLHCLCAMRIIKIEYSIKKMLNICYFYIYKIFTSLFFQKEFEISIIEKLENDEGKQKTQSYQLFDKKGNQFYFKEINQEMQNMYQYIKNQYIEEIQLQNITQEKLQQVGILLLHNYFDLEHERLQLVSSIITQLFVIFHKSEKYHLSILVLIINIFRYRNSSQKQVLSEINQYLIEIQKFGYNDYKLRLKHFYQQKNQQLQQNISQSISISCQPPSQESFEGATIGFIQNSVIFDNQDIIEILINILSNANYQYTQLNQQQQLEKSCFQASLLESLRIEMIYVSKLRTKHDDEQMKFQKRVLQFAQRFSGLGTMPLAELSHRARYIYLNNVLSCQMTELNILVQSISNSQAILSKQSKEQNIKFTNKLFNQNSQFFENVKEMLYNAQQFNYNDNLSSTDSTKLTTGSMTNMTMNTQSLAGDLTGSQQIGNTGDKNQINFTQITAFKEFGGARFLQTLDQFEKNFATVKSMSFVFELREYITQIYQELNKETNYDILQNIIEYFFNYTIFLRNKFFYLFNIQVKYLLQLQIQVNSVHLSNIFQNPSEYVKDRMTQLIEDNLPITSSNFAKVFLTENDLKVIQANEGKMPKPIINFIFLCCKMIILRGDAQFLEQMNCKQHLIDQYTNINNSDGHTFTEQLKNTDKFFFDFCTDNNSSVEMITNMSADTTTQTNAQEVNKLIIIKNEFFSLFCDQLINQITNKQDEELKLILLTLKTITLHYFVKNQMASVLGSVHFINSKYSIIQQNSIQTQQNYISKALNKIVKFNFFDPENNYDKDQLFDNYFMKNKSSAISNVQLETIKKQSISNQNLQNLSNQSLQMVERLQQQIQNNSKQMGNNSIINNQSSLKNIQVFNNNDTDVELFQQNIQILTNLNIIQSNNLQFVENQFTEVNYNKIIVFTEFMQIFENILYLIDKLVQADCKIANRSILQQIPDDLLNEYLNSKYTDIHDKQLIQKKKEQQAAQQVQNQINEKYINYQIKQMQQKLDVIKNTEDVQIVQKATFNDYLNILESDVSNLYEICETDNFFKFNVIQQLTYTQSGNDLFLNQLLIQLMKNYQNILLNELLNNVQQQIKANVISNTSSQKKKQINTVQSTNKQNQIFNINDEYQFCLFGINKYFNSLNLNQQRLTENNELSQIIQSFSQTRSFNQRTFNFVNNQLFSKVTSQAQIKQHISDIKSSQQQFIAYVKQLHKQETIYKKHKIFMMKLGQQLLNVWDVHYKQLELNLIAQYFITRIHLLKSNVCNNYQLNCNNFIDLLISPNNQDSQFHNVSISQQNHYLLINDGSSNQSNQKQQKNQQAQMLCDNMYWQKNLLQIYYYSKIKNEMQVKINEQLNKTVKPTNPFTTENVTKSMLQQYQTIFDIYKLLNPVNKTKFMVEFNQITPGVTGISSLEQQQMLLLWQVQNQNYQFSESPALHNFFKSFIKSFNSIKQNNKIGQINNFQLAVMYQKLLKDLNNEFKHDNSLFRTLNNYTFNQLLYKQMQLLLFNNNKIQKQLSKVKNSQQTYINYYVHQQLTQFQQFKQKQQVNINHLTSYCDIQEDILSILVSKVYSDSVQVMLTHQTIIEQYIDQNKFTINQQLQSVLLEQKIKGLNYLFENTQLTIFSEITQLEQELFQFDDLCRIESLLLNREICFQHTRLNKIEFEYQNYCQLEDSELKRLIALNKSLQQINSQKQHNLRKQLAIVQNQLKHVVKEEEALSQQVKQVQFDSNKDAEQVDLGKKNLIPLQALADNVTGYNKMCVDLEMVKKLNLGIQQSISQINVINKQLEDQKVSELQNHVEKSDQLQKQLKILKQKRAKEVELVNNLNNTQIQLNSNNYVKLDDIQQSSKKSVADAQNQIYINRTQLTKKQEQLKKMLKLISIYQDEEQKRKGNMYL